MPFENINFQQPTQAPDLNPTVEEPPPDASDASDLQQGLLIEYRFAWECEDQFYAMGDDVPLVFALTRRDGQNVEIPTEASMDIMLPDATTITIPMEDMRCDPIQPAAQLLLSAPYTLDQGGTYSVKCHARVGPMRPSARKMLAVA